jgi:hypothetical protein
VGVGVGAGVGVAGLTATVGPGEDVPVAAGGGAPGPPHADAMIASKRSPVVHVRGPRFITGFDRTDRDRATTASKLASAVPDHAAPARASLTSFGISLGAFATGMPASMNARTFDSAVP